jgi:histidinol-phosphate/aromatic aminotransferase/cobyric acid decarboxylase-like protein
MDHAAEQLDSQDEPEIEIASLTSSGLWAETRNLDPQEKERFYSRLSTIPKVRTMPSIGDWILIQVPRPADVARKVNRRLAPGVVSVPRQVPGTVRLHVSDPKSNELLFRTLREVVA